jgi:hypothetical protein
VRARNGTQQADRDRLHLLPPFHYVWPAAWEPRIRTLCEDSSLDDALRRVRERARSGDGRGAEAELRATLERFADLLPGAGGEEIARAIVAGERVYPWRQSEPGSFQQRDVFCDPVAPFQARTRNRERNLSQPRRLRFDYPRLFATLEGDDSGRPRSRAQTRAELGWSSAQLRRHLDSAKRRGYAVRSQPAQDLIAALHASTRSA